MAHVSGHGSVRQLVEASRDPSLLLREDGSAELVNAAFMMLTGADRLRLEGFGWLGVIHQGELAASHAFWTSRLSARTPFEADVRVRAYDGGYVAYRVESTPLEFGRWFVTMTARPQLALQAPSPLASDEALRALMFEHMREAAFAWELDGRPRILVWNHAAERLYGYSFAEVVHRSPHVVLRTLFPISQSHAEAVLRRDRRWAGELRHTTRDGTVLTIDAQLDVVVLSDGRSIVLESARDVTARRRDEHALIEASARLRLALGASKMGIWEWDVVDDRLHWSPEHFSILGMKPEQFGGRRDDFARVVHPDDLSSLWENFERQLASGSDFDAEFRVIRGDGEVRIVHNRGLIERNALGAAVRVVGTIADVTEARQTAAQLRQFDTKLRALADAMPQLAWSVRADDGWVEWINARMHAFVGFDVAELRAKGWQAILHPDDVDRFHTAWPASPIADRAREIEVRMRTTTGDYRWFLARGVPELDARGSVVRWFSTATDIDDRHALEQSLRARATELQGILDAVPAAVWLTHDPEAREVIGNPVGYAMLRSNQDRNLSKTGNDADAVAHFTVWRDGVELAPEMLPLQRAARGETVRGFSEEIRFDDGSVVHVYGNATPLLDANGQPAGSVAAFIDVTPLHEAQAALRELARRKDDFLAMLSHELRNPLAAIGAAVEVIANNGDVALPRQRDVLVRQTAQLTKLVDDLLDAARLANGKVELSRASHALAPIVEKALETVRGEAQAKNQTLTVDVPKGLDVDVDETRFTQVICNLLTNAVRYTQAGGHITLTAKRHGDDVQIEIRDNGSGIEPALLPHVFELFVQARVSGGLGLGLPMVKRLVELHGGSIEVTSAGVGRGTTAKVSIRASKSARAIAPGSDVLPRAGSRQILLVDDNVDAADLLAILLETAGHEVRTVHDGHAALALLDGWTPELAILDLGLPGIDGFELGAEIKRRLPAVHLVAVTGYASEKDRQRTAAAGFAAHLAKPVSATTLLALLARLR